MRPEDEEALRVLEFRLRTILPAEYQDSYEDVQPVSMGSAGLKYGSDGKVAWDEIWGTFCDLAMAGGPPHKGSLLEPGSRADIAAEPACYQEAVNEICRGVNLVTGLVAVPDATPGWARVDCESEGMADWLVRAIVMENVSTRFAGKSLYLPAGPAYRLEKEIKNVITAIAKTCHYWEDHMWSSQQREIIGLFELMERESPLVQPALPEDHDQVEGQEKMAGIIGEATGLQALPHRYQSWVGLECPSVHFAIWMMRALVVSNVLARREGTALFVPVNPSSDAGGERASQAVIRIHRFALARNVL